MRTVLRDDFMDRLIDEGLAKGFAIGLAKGRAEMLLLLLDSRFVVPANIRGRVGACTDAAQIRTWFKRTLNASSLDEVFAKLWIRRSPRAAMEPARDETTGISVAGATEIPSKP
jgi:hypothetical protein